MVDPRQHRPAARRLDGGDDFRRVGGDQHRADVGFRCATPDMDDHRLAVDVGERLAGQAGRAEAGGDDDDRVVTIGLGSTPAEARQMGARRAYTCCQVARKAANQGRGAARRWRVREYMLTYRGAGSDADDGHQQNSHVLADGAAAHQGSGRVHRRRFSRRPPIKGGLRPADRSGGRSQARRCAKAGPAARPARQSRRQEGRGRRQSLPGLPFVRKGRRRQGRTAALWRDRPSRRAPSPASPIPTA